jgi:hypothetical protein
MTRNGSPKALLASAPLLGAAAAAGPEAIGDFLAGRNDGEVVLHGLYDHVIEEPVPERIAGLLDEAWDQRRR